MKYEEAVEQLKIIKASLIDCGGCKGSQQSLDCIDLAIKVLETGDIYMTGEDYSLFMEGYKSGLSDGRKDALQSKKDIIKCQDCKHRVKEWREDKRMKDKGYWAYGCSHFGELSGYWCFGGCDDEYCSDAEKKDNNM